MKPHNGYFGDWTQFEETSCGTNFITGVALHYDPPGDVDYDDWGATDLKMICNYDTELHTTPESKYYYTTSFFFNLITLKMFKS